jgi:serine/threonine-protein kinase RIO1
MLAHNVVHADLSAFNILYWDGEIVLIDYPQAVDSLSNRQAEFFFTRDINRVCQYFACQGGGGGRRGTGPRDVGAVYARRAAPVWRAVDVEDAADLAWCS